MWLAMRVLFLFYGTFWGGICSRLFFKGLVKFASHSNQFLASLLGVSFDASILPCVTGVSVFDFGLVTLSFLVLLLQNSYAMFWSVFSWIQHLPAVPCSSGLPEAARTHACTHAPPLSPHGLSPSPPVSLLNSPPLEVKPHAYCMLVVYTTV